MVWRSTAQWVLQARQSSKGAQAVRDSSLRFKRFLGLELSGAKNQKTALASLEYYPKEKKIFLLDIYEKIGANRSEIGHSHSSTSSSSGPQTADEALLELIAELTEGQKSGSVVIGTNIGSTLPPSLDCTHRNCLPRKCTLPAVKWMREITRKQIKQKNSDVRVTEFTPYTQRPVELWLRYQVMPRLPSSHRFEIDESLGGNKAPLTMRMHFLKRHLGNLEIVEVIPKLSVAVLALELGISKRIIQSYRNLEEGIHAREEILDALSERFGVFIYERDLRKLAHNLASFDAFICAFTALLADQDLCAKPPSGFPIQSGWVQYPDPESPLKWGGGS